jgi:HSP20 family protein
MNTCIETTTNDAAAADSERIRATSPLLDVIETPEGFRLEIEVPGAGKDDVELKVEKGILTVRARVPVREAEERRYHVREHGPRDLCRRVHVGDAIDAEHIAAEVRNGLLTVSLPKVAAAQPRRIEVG